MGKARESVFKGLKELAKVGTTDLNPLALAEFIKGESDRGAVILGATMVDDAVRERLMQHFKEARSDDRRRLFENGGPASSFSSRTLLAKSIGLVSSEDADTLEVLRHMRNACAHAQQDIHFGSPQLRAAFGLLSKEANPPVETYSRSQMRDLFILLCSTLYTGIRGGGYSKEILSANLPFMQNITSGCIDRW